MSRREWMRTLCGESLATAIPFGAEWNGGKWDFVTNGFALLAVRGQTWPEREEAPSACEALDLLQILRGNQVSTRALWNWIEAEPCARCFTLGGVNALGQLMSGHVWEAPGQVCGITVNRLRLAEYLMPIAWLSAAPEAVCVAVADRENPLFVYEASKPKEETAWIVALMPMRTKEPGPELFTDGAR